MSAIATVWLLAAGALAITATLWPRIGLWARWREHVVQRRRELTEDALKHVLAWEHRGKTATPESISGALGIPSQTVLALVTRMTAKSLLRSAESGLRLTTEGERLALHIVRAHRLWERYLADDAGVPMTKLHRAAEKAEHTLSVENLDELDAHLGHPLRDPHGDPIPTREGSIDALDASSLTTWPPDQLASIVHIEDEPPVVFDQIVAAGLRPGMNVRVLERAPERIVLSDGVSEHRLSHAVAANIQVAAAIPVENRLSGAVRLCDLRPNQAGIVLELDESYRGFGRRRLMDLGLTPGARVQAALENTFGDPRGFRVRGALIALRRDQAANVWLRLPEAEQAPEPAAEESVV